MSDTEHDLNKTTTPPETDQMNKNSFSTVNVSKDMPPADKTVFISPESASDRSGDSLKASQVNMEDIVSLCKRRGFIFQGSEVYGGLSGTWDYGPLGVTLKRNIMKLWWDMFVDGRDDMYGVDAAILMNQKVWQASGHVDTFTDPLVECSNCKGRFRADKLDDPNKCPSCGKLGTFGEARAFNMMFSTAIGPTGHSAWEEYSKKVSDFSEKIKTNSKDFKFADYQEIFLDFIESSNKFVVSQNSNENISYLRPETAQGIFTNFKNVVDTFYPDLPFGIGQQGKAFRNEISPRDFVFRSREFEQMEVEYFVDPAKWEESFEMWVGLCKQWFAAIGLPADMVHELEVEKADRAHYSKRTIDFEFDFPIGREELMGLAYRTDFDLGNIERVSGKNMKYAPKAGGPAFVPHVIEPSFGVERAIMAVLCSAYREDELNGEKRVYLALPDHIAPVKYVVSPLVRNKPELVAKARKVYEMMRKKYGAVLWDDNSNVGKRYRRADEIGVPYCITIDFQTLEDDTVTIRDRNTAEQVRKEIINV